MKYRFLRKYLSAIALAVSIALLIGVTSTATSHPTPPTTSQPTPPATSSTANPASITLTGTIRDFQSAHPDFEERISGVVPDVVQIDLGPDKKPVFAGLNGRASITEQASFDQWYRDVPSVNLSKQLLMRALYGEHFLQFDISTKRASRALFRKLCVLTITRSQ